MPMDKRTTKSPYMSLDAAAEYLGWHRNTVRKFIAQGRIKGYRIANKSVRVKRADIEALIQEIPTSA